MDTTTANCSTCRYLATTPGADRVLVSLCRRYPPIPVGSALISPQGRPVVVVDTVYPQIGSPADHWCGEHSSYVMVD